MAVKTNSKKAATKSATKRKRLIDEDIDNNHRITFKRIKKEEYDHQVHTELQSSASTQTHATPERSHAKGTASTPRTRPQIEPILRDLANARLKANLQQQALPSSGVPSSAFEIDPTFHRASQPSTQTQETLARMHDSHITRLERNSSNAYDFLKHGEDPRETDPRELISCMARMATDHLVRLDYNLDGIMRATAVAHLCLSEKMMEDAWEYARAGEVIPLELLQSNDGLLSSDKMAHEQRKTHPEAVFLMYQPIKTIGLAHLQKVLLFSWSIATQIHVEGLSQPEPPLLVQLMRHFGDRGYDLDTVMQAMAMEILHEKMEKVDVVWQSARMKKTRISKYST